MHDYVDDKALEPLFSREELLKHRCDLLESELAELGDELQASREKISTLVVMWSGVTAELRAAEAEIIKMRSLAQPNDHDRAHLG